ncbi:MAG: VCBS repeat-containing protein, partial [Acidobacteriota bacterium]
MGDIEKELSEVTVLCVGKERRMQTIHPQRVLGHALICLCACALAGTASFALLGGEMAAPSFTRSSQDLPFLMTRQVALGDLDEDGDLDAVFANMGTNDSLVWLNNGTGRFSDSGQKLTRQGHGVAVRDLDGDGDRDIFIACAEYNDHPLPSRIYLNDGNGQFSDSGQNLGDGAKSGVEVALFDVDGDRDLDAMVGYYPDESKIYRNDGHGRFSDSRIAVSGMPFPADLNRDGFIDFFIKDLGRGYQTLVNDGKGHFKKRWSLN